MVNIVLDNGAYKPERAHEWDAGYDLRTPEPFIVHKGESAIIDTGVHFEIPHGWFGKIESKSGLMTISKVTAPGGIIDAGYTGSVVVMLKNDSGYVKRFDAGDKIAQIIFVPCGMFDLHVVDDLKETERGNNGFGSTGV